MKWFYTLRNTVKGPLTTQELEAVLNQIGQDVTQTLVWTRGQSDWTPAEMWTPTERPTPSAERKTEKRSTSNEDTFTKKDSVPNMSEADLHAKLGLLSPEENASDKNAREKPTPQPNLKRKIAPTEATPKISIPTEPNPTPGAAKSHAKNREADLTATRVKNTKADPDVLEPLIKPQPEPEPISRIADPADIIVPSDEEITRLLGATAVEVIESVTDKVEEKFRVQYNGADQPLMTRKELIEFTALQADPGLIMIWDRKSDEWKEIYTFTDIIEKLGISRRQNRRVTILGQFKGKSRSGQDLALRLTTISMGGFGVTDCFDLKIGDEIMGQITSPHFYSPLAISAEVTYAGSHGNVGLKFTSISDEGQALVVDYIKKFGKGVKTENA